MPGQLPFEINASAYTLKYNNQSSAKVILDEITAYEIPIYQRPYSWTKEQINKFISDLIFSYRDNTGEIVKEPMFIGTMQLSAILNGKHEVIDGQQRLTTLLILIKVLKERAPISQLAAITINWLSTRVNNGLQQQYLDELIQTDLHAKEETLNPYIYNGYLIKELIDEAFIDNGDGPVIVDLNDFINHLLSNIYFVVIETRAGLSKTLQIFNAINTAGLDLNGSDIFKLRMYEYLTTRQGYGENAFEDISRLYEKIDQLNDRFNNKIASMNEILGIYQSILIATNNLPVTLNDYNTDTFFERLFDTIFNINQWEHFRNNVNQIKLCLEDIDKIIDARFEWQARHKETAEDLCAINLIWWSRYSRHWRVILIFMYKFKKDEQCHQNMFLLTRQLCKLYCLYSVRYSKGINEIHRFSYTLIKAILEKSFVEIIGLVNDKIGNLEHYNRRELEKILNGDIVQNAKMKNIICRMSAMLSENYTSSNKDDISEIYHKLFEDAVDIEHIQSYLDYEHAKRDLIIKEWNLDLNALGNLVVLEQRINRSIKNHPYDDKIKAYAKSNYESIRQILQEYPSWDLLCCQNRKKKEINKLVNYVFN